MNETNTVLILVFLGVVFLVPFGIAVYAEVRRAVIRKRLKNGTVGELADDL